MISNFFILSPRGDTILAKDYRFDGVLPPSPDLVDLTAPPSADGDGSEAAASTLPESLLRTQAELFFRKVKFWDDMTGSTSDRDYENPATNRATQVPGASSDGASTSDGNAGSSVTAITKVDAPPLFMIDGVSYIHIKRSGLYFVVTTRRNVSPSEVGEMLNKVVKVFKDYCGFLSEEAIRKNFILLYELLDEMIDYGFPQVTATESLKMFIHNEAIPTSSPSTSGAASALASVVGGAQGGSGSSSRNTAAAMSAHKPIAGSLAGGAGGGSGAKNRNEIFVDILERLNVLFSPNGAVLNFTIDGCIQMKSYLAGNPELRLALNEDLIVGRAADPTRSKEYGAVVIDDVNFNDCVNLAEFESSRTLSFFPPDGEFVVLNYRLASVAPPPFKIFPAVEDTAPMKLEVTVTVRAELPPDNHGANVSVKVPLPRCTAGVSYSMTGTANPDTGQTCDYLANERRVVWNIKKFAGGTSLTLKLKVTLSQASTAQIRKEVGPVAMGFEVPMYNVSRLAVRYLRIAETTKNYDPYRWVRYVTQSSSYVCRVGV